MTTAVPIRAPEPIVECQARCMNNEGGTAVQELMNNINEASTIDNFNRLVKKYDAIVASGGYLGQTPLMHIVKVGNLQLARKVIEKYGYFLMNLGDEFGRTPIHTAADLEDEELSLSFMELFKSFGDMANFNIAGRNRDLSDTPLERAQKANHVSVVRYLIERCRVANPNNISVTQKRSTETPSETSDPKRKKTAVQVESTKQ